MSAGSVEMAVLDTALVELADKDTGGSVELIGSGTATEELLETMLEEGVSSLLAEYTLRELTFQYDSSNASGLLPT